MNHCGSWRRFGRVGSGGHLAESISSLAMKRLHLHYEQAQTRQVPQGPGGIISSTHFPWIGERTRGLDGAHVEYFRGISNPVAVKLGPSARPDEAVTLAKI